MVDVTESVLPKRITISVTNLHFVEAMRNVFEDFEVDKRAEYGMSFPS